MHKTRVFQSGNSQAIRLPKEFQLAQKEVWISKIGDQLLISLKPQGWEQLEDSLGQFSDDFMAERGQPPIQERETF